MSRSRPNNTAAARLANERKATALEPGLIEAMLYCPVGMFLSNGECARFLATASGLAPEGSIKVYLRILANRGDAGSKFYRAFAARTGPALERHNAMFPDKPGQWVNREGPPAEPAEPAPEPVEPEPAPEPVEPEPAPPLMYFPEGDGPWEQDRGRHFGDNRPNTVDELRRAIDESYNPFKWRYG